MATPNQQRSRYPRPLKATQSFTASGEAAGPQAAGQQGNSSVVSNCATTNASSCNPPPSSPGTSTASGEATKQTMVGAGGKGASGSPPGSPGSRRTEAGTKAQNDVDLVIEVEGENPRRSSSMDCLSDPDSYMNSLWPRLSSTNQGTDPDSDSREGFSHKRSNSCSGADRLPKTPPLKGNSANAVHTRTSIEGLNQEVSSALEGKQIMPSQHPDGHRAPIRDLVGRPPVCTPTPPHSLGLTGHAYPTSQSPSPYTYSPHPMSPIQASHSASFTETSDTPTGHSNTQNRESPGAPDNAHHHPSSPKPSFAHEPPDGAERCIIKQELRYTADHIPRGPDKSKASIVYRGSDSAFAPLLPAHSLKPIGGVAS